MKHIQLVVIAMLLFCSLFTQIQPGYAQQTISTNTSVVVPPLVNFSGVLTDLNGKPLTGVVGVTFSLYKDEQGGAPLWLETQNVTADKNGHYSVLLGSTTSTGLPADIFVAGEAHWLGVQVQAQQQEEQPRVLLVSAPYALKAGDAQTLGGLPASAFVLAAPVAKSATAAAGTTVNSTKAVTEAAITGTGKPGYLPLWSTTTNLSESLLFESGGKIGINTTTPAATVDVTGNNGSEILHATQSGIGSAIVATASGAGGSGVVATTSNATGVGVSGTASSTTSSAFGGIGVYGFSSNPIGYGVEGTSGNVGVYGTGGSTSSVTGIGVKGTGNQYGVSGNVAIGTAANQAGVFGTTSITSANTFGVEGTATATSGTEAGVFGTSASTAGYGVLGTSPNVGLAGAGTGPGGIGVDGHGNAIGVKGVATASGGVSGYFGGGPVEVAGNANNAFFGDPGCGGGFSGFGLTSDALSGCNNYTMIGKSSGDVYLNSTLTGAIHFRNGNSGGNSNGDLATLDHSGNLTVAGAVHSSGNALAMATASNQAYANLGGCTFALSAPNSSCLTPNMKLTVTTSGGPVLIMATIGGVSTGYYACQTANFYLVMDNQFISQQAYNANDNNLYQVGSVVLMTLQTPAAGMHTFQVQESDDYTQCGGDDEPTDISVSFSFSSPSRTLIVREF